MAGKWFQHGPCVGSSVQTLPATKNHQAEAGTCYIQCFARCAGVTVAVSMSAAVHQVTSKVYHLSQISARAARSTRGLQRQRPQQQ